MTDEQEASKPKAAPEITPQMLLDGWLDNILTCALRGSMSCLSEVPPHILLDAACRSFGRVAGRMVRGDMDVVMTTRRALRTSFGDGINSAPPVPLPPGHGAPAPKTNGAG